ncbi:MAG: hypothetical protein ACWGQW_14815, partial [bacterium]
GQESNSVHVEKLAGLRAVNYCLQYVKKGQYEIHGQRYALSEDLYGEFKPTQFKIVGRHARSIFLRYITCHASSVLNGKGYLGDWGVVIPSPDRNGVTRYRSREFIVGLAQELAEFGYPELLDHLEKGEKHHEETDCPF